VKHDLNAELAELQAEIDQVDAEQATERHARNLGPAMTSAFSAVMQKLDIIAKKERTVSVPDLKLPNITVNVEPTPVEVIVQPPPVNVAAPNVRVTVERPAPRVVRVETDPDTGDRLFIPED
jgi:hypothetical protein